MKKNTSLLSLLFFTILLVPSAYSQDCENQDTMEQPSNQEVCSGSDLSGVSFSSDLPGTTYNWTASYPGILDQSNTSPFAGSGYLNNLWQSFTAGHTARLSRVSISLYQTNTSGTLNIYSGQGTSGSLLYSGSFSASTGSSDAWVDIPIASPLTITEGSVYTMSLVTSSDTMWASLGQNNYSGGISNQGSNIDLLFKTYIIQNDFFGLPPILSGTGDIPSFTASNVLQDPSTNSFLGPAIVNYTVTPELNGCFGTPKTFSITINPLSQVVQPQNQVVCNSENTAAIYFTGGEAGTTYSWTNNTPSIGLAASGTGDIASFIGINNGTSPVTANITVSQSADVCNSSTQRTFTITVKPTTMVNQPSNQVLCNLTSTEEVGFSGGVAGTTYNWTNNTPSIGLAASGTGDIASFIGTNNGTSPLIATITVTPILAGCAGDSKTFTITVNPPNVIMNQPSNQEVCSGSDLSGVSFSSDLPGTTYNWTASYPGILDQSNTSPFAGSGYLNNLWQSFTAGHTARLSRVSISLYQTNTSGTLNIYSGQGTSGSLLYSGSFSASTGSSDAWVDIPIASPLTITEGSVYTMSLVTSSDTMWASLGQNNYSGGISNQGSNIDLLFKTYIIQNDFFGLPPILSGTGDIPSFTASNVLQDPSTNSFLGPAIVNYTVTPELNGCFGTPKTFSITINPLSQVVQPQNQVVCNSENTAAIYFTGGEAGTTYSWTNNTPSIGLAASGTGDIASFIGINNGTSPVTANITVSQSADVCNSSTQRTFTITVKPTTMVNQPSNQVLCNLTSTEEVGFSGGVAGTTYNWTNNTPSIGLAASGTGDIASFIGTNNGTSPLIATITVTPILAGCAGDSKTFTITVNPPNVIMNQPSNQEVCSGSDLSGVSFSSDLPGTTYNWTASYPGILDQSNTSPFAGSGYLNNLWQSFTAGHTARLSRVSISLYQTNTSGTLNIYSGQGTSGSLLYSGSFSASTGSSDAWVDIPIASPLTITEGSVYTMSLVTSSDTMWASLGQNNYSGGISNQGSNIDLLFKTYIIQNDFFGLPPILSGTGDIPSFTASNVLQDPSTNSFLGPAIVNYTVTPELNGCFGTPKTFSITINNYTDEIVNPINNQTLYSGETINPVIFSGGSAGTIYSWENDNPSIGLAASGIGNIGFFEVVNNGLSPVTANIIVTPLKGSCAGESQNFTITVNPPIPLTITGLTGDDKVYDGSTVGTASGTPSLSGVEAGDDVSLVGPPTFTFASPNVGTDIIITSTGYTLSGVDAGNYTLIQPSLSSDITPAVLTVTADAGQTKVYGAIDPPLTYTITGLVSGDSEAELDTAVSISRSVGESVGNYTITPSAAADANYTISYVTNPFVITQATLTITGLTGDDKVYDGSTVATASGTPSLSGVEAGDEVSLVGPPTFTFASPNVGTDITITSTGYTLSGVDAGNYTLIQPSLSSDITPAVLTVTADAGQTKVYGAIDPPLTYTITGLVSGDSEAELDTAVSISRSVGESVGNYTITPSAAADANYTISYVTNPFVITQATLTITGLTGDDKVYDGSTVATASGTPSLSGVEAGDEVSLVGPPTFTFASPNVGTDITITSTGYTLSGVDAGNYTLIQPSLSSDITPAVLTVTADAGQTKVYGAIDPPLTYTITGLVSGDSEAELDTAVSISRSVGESVGNYTITPSAAADANYTISYVTNPFVITQATLTITGLTGDDKVYDGSTVATASGTPSLSGVEAGDEVSLVGPPTFTFASPNVGTDITITSTGYTLSGVDAGNYTLIQPSLSSDITPAVLTVTADAGQTKVYGAIDPPLTYTITGLVSGDSEAELDTAVSISRSVGESVGNYTITPSAAADANYTISYVTNPFVITQATLTITGLTGDDKVYDGSTVATASGTPSLSGVEAGDEVSLVGPPTFTFASPNVGTDITITSTGYTLSGVDAGNYSLTQPTLSADITSTLGLDDFSETTPSLKLFPNPAIEYIQISGLSKKVNYTIYNILGKKVLTGNVVNDEGIYIQNLANGLYLLKFNNGNTIKFIKK